MDKFKLNFLSQGKLESLSLDKFFLTVFKIIPCHEVFLVTNFLPLLLECSAEVILKDSVTMVSRKLIKVQWLKLLQGNPHFTLLKGDGSYI